MYQPGPFTPHTVPVRSSIPRVIGILAIIFSCIGVGMSAIFTIGPLHDVSRWHAQPKLGFVVTWLHVWAAASCLLFVLHLMGGILAVSYRALGLRVLTAYAVGALVLIVLDLIILNGFVSGSRLRDSVSLPRTVFSLGALVWPIVVLALVNTRRARQAASC